MTTHFDEAFVDRFQTTEVLCSCNQESIIALITKHADLEFHFKCAMKNIAIQDRYIRQRLKDLEENKEVTLMKLLKKWFTRSPKNEENTFA